MSYPTKMEYASAVAGALDDALLLVGIGGGIVEWRIAAPEATALYLIHAMGMPPAIGLGLSLSLPHRRVFAFDGDGGMLMHLGSLATIGALAPANLSIVIFDNNAYGSTSFIPSAARTTNLAAVARAAGIPGVATVATVAEFSSAVQHALATAGPHVIHVHVDPSNYDGPAPQLDVLENKYAFVRKLECQEEISLIDMYQGTWKRTR